MVSYLTSVGLIELGKLPSVPLHKCTRSVKRKRKNKKESEEMIIYASVVCSMLGVRVLWLVQIEVP